MHMFASMMRVPGITINKYILLPLGIGNIPENILGSLFIYF